jgi:lipopolysaccharide biosynthesis regulator YciM
MGFVLPASQLGVSGWEENLSAAGFPEAASLARGTLALQERRYADAVALLQTAWDQHSSVRVYGAWIAEALSTAFEQSGNLGQAAKALERASAERLENPPQWLRNEARLSGLYRRLGRNSDARRIEARLRKLLAFADADNPVLEELKAR